MKQRGQILNNDCKPFSATLFILLIFSMVLFSANLVSAFEFDNVKSYDERTKTVTIGNAFGLGGDIAQVKLVSGLNVVVPRGYQKVAEFRVTSFEDYNNFISELEFFDIRNDYKSINRVVDYKVQNIRWTLVDDYGPVKTGETANKTAIFEEQVIGSHFENVITWVNLNMSSFKKDGNITIGIFTDVQKNDKVEWIPTFAGVRVEEWASFSASLKVGLLGYWPLQETSGLIAVDSTHQQNGTIATGGNVSVGVNECGIINTGYNFTSDVFTVDVNQWIDITGITSTTGDYSFSFWGSSLNNFERIVWDTTSGRFFIYESQGANGIGYFDGGVTVFGELMNSTLLHYVFTFNTGTSNASLYESSILTSSNTNYNTRNIGGTTYIGSNKDGANNIYGCLSEFGFWNRTITPSEVIDLWNGGAGLSFDAIVGAAGLNLTLIAPADNYNQANLSDIVFNVTVTDNLLVENVTLFYNGVINQTNSSNHNGTYLFTVPVVDGDFDWNIFAFDNESNFVNSSVRTLTVDTLPPNITVTSPTEQIGFSKTGNEQVINWTMVDTNIDTCLWDYNGTNFTIGCLVNTTTVILEPNNFNIIYYANDTSGNMASLSKSWSYKLFEVNQTFNNITTEGATETFIIHFTKTPLLQVSTVSLVYNGVFHSFPYIVSGDNVSSESSITTPLVSTDTNLSFHWNISLSDGSSVITGSNNQTVLNIQVDNCSVFTNLIYNFTMYDEENKLMLGDNTFLELQVNLFDLSGANLVTEFSQNFTNVNPITFCSQNPILPTVNYSSYVVAKYSANQTLTNKTYSIEYYNILNQTIGNFTTPINISLYDLKEEDTTKFRLTFRDSSYVLAPNILVQIHRQYVTDNDFKIVEIPLTDSNGQTILNLVRNTIVYNLIMVDEAGNIVGIFNSIKAFCQDFTIDDCTINLAPDSSTPTVFDYDDEFNIFISSPSYDNSTKIISINFLTDDLTSKEVKMVIERNNQFGNRSVCTDSLLSASGVLSCDVSSVSDIDQFLFISIYVDGPLARQDTINLNSNVLSFGTINGSFYAFLLILFLITMFMEDKKVLVVSLGLGWVVIISLGLINGLLVGSASAGIWILVTIAIFLWKLNSEETR